MDNSTSSLAAMYQNHMQQVGYRSVSIATLTKIIPLQGWSVTCLALENRIKLWYATKKQEERDSHNPQDWYTPEQW